MMFGCVLGGFILQVIYVSAKVELTRIYAIMKFQSYFLFILIQWFTLKTFLFF